LTWAPTPPKSHPINYFVPHFGEDHDVVATKKHESQAGETLGHTWTPTKDKDGEWELPSEDAFFRLSQKHYKVTEI
jgi:hypothetical protein